MIGSRLTLGAAGRGVGESVSSATALFAGGYTTTNIDVIETINVANTGNATDFGDLTVARNVPTGTSNGSNNRAIFAGGEVGSTASNVIDYVSMSSAGNASDFGDLLAARTRQGATSNGTNGRGIFGGGYETSTAYADITYISIGTPGNSANFGSLTSARRELAATSSATNNRGVFAGGRNSSDTTLNEIEYVTISTAGNSADFGDLTATTYYHAACSSGTNGRGVFGGGYATVSTMSYVTLSTTGNATACAGGLTLGRYALAATSNGTGNRGVFAGGSNAGRKNTIDYMNISTASAATDFGDLTATKTGNAGTSNA